MSFSYTIIRRKSHQKPTNTGKNNTNIIPEYGDQLITLSTCESTYEDGRFVIVGVRRVK